MTIKKLLLVMAFVVAGLLLSAQAVNTTYYKNGSVRTTEYILDDNVQKITYFKNGNIKEIANYQNGKLHGRCMEYDRRERLISQGEFHKGMKVGKWLEYDKAQKKVYEVKYVDDRKVSEKEWAREKQ
jgi:antitoxin component YwqK of YwqJK toxin-antitoxin module